MPLTHFYFNEYCPIAILSPADYNTWQQIKPHKPTSNEPLKAWSIGNKNLQIEIPEKNFFWGILCISKPFFDQQGSGPSYKAFQMAVTLADNRLRRFLGR